MQVYACNNQAMAFSPDGKIFAAAQGQSIRVWAIDRAEELVTLQGHSDLVTDIAFSPDSQQVASSSRDRTIRIWSIRNGSELQTLRGHTGFVTSVVYAENGRSLVSVGLDMSLRRWSLLDKADVLTYRGHMDELPKVRRMPVPKGKARTQQSAGLQLPAVTADIPPVPSLPTFPD